ncbi:MAG TPA: hypothetical protein VLZ31_03815 [Microbacteriaceae bacterium]|nr:hypothetical protein [Microbacteriaceae bacterium]
MGDTTFNTDFPNASAGFSEGQPFNGTWTLEIPEFSLPAEASYAIVGYAIKVGQVADPVNSNGTQPFLKTNNSPVNAAPNSFWVNTAAASKGTFNNNQEIEPSRCRISDLDNEIMFTGWDENISNDANFSDCKTYHTLEENFFHFWKQGSDVVSEQNPQGNDLPESHFVLADSKSEAEDGIASKWLCRADNRVVPTGPGGTFRIDDMPIQLPGQGTGAPAWDYDSRQPGGVYDSIVKANAARAAHNDSNPNDQVPLLDTCGLFFIHTEADRDGQPVGSWHAQDIRGGDDTNWRDDPNQPGTYWVAEMKSPDDYQLLSQPMKMWVAPPIPTPNYLHPGDRGWYDYQGRLSLPVLGEGESFTPDAAGVISGTPDIRKQCVNPWQLPPNSQPMCIMPTGWTAPIFDAKLQPLPLTGGFGNGLLIGGGAAFFALITAIVLLRRAKAKNMHNDLQISQSS